ncbi:hypothetical protein BC937DRAFT_92925 [Endogone sp. FLAS-F59071]|nr:hypothetical protein BC937DRAFT_92925 [Endogone sp. FLAS-F59071]|eukprot:RUS21358.1 hypothetical protein BC937DRAFT_92925 [Endogone sp. FLAS-F59071]
MSDHDITLYLDPLLGSTNSVKDKIFAATKLAGSIQFLSDSALDDFLAHVSLDYPRKYPEETVYQQVASIVLRKAAKLRTADFFNHFNRDFVRNEWPVLTYNEQDPSKVALIQIIFWVVKYKKPYVNTDDQWHASYKEDIKQLRELCFENYGVIASNQYWLDHFKKFWELLPDVKPAQAFTAAWYVIDSLAKMNLASPLMDPTTTPEIQLHISIVTRFWGTNDGEQHLRFTLFNIFERMHQTDRQCSPVLGALLTHVPLESATAAFNRIRTSPPEQFLKLGDTLQCLLDWLPYHWAKGFGALIVELMEALRGAHHEKLLIEATRRNIRSVFKLIMRSDRREDAWVVFLTMLLGYQHSPDAFHLIVPDVITVLNVVAREPAQRLLNDLSHAIQCCVFKFSGYPQLYGPIVISINKLGLPILSDEERKGFVDRVNQAKWVSGTAVTVDTSTNEEYLKLEPGSRVGLRNLVTVRCSRPTQAGVAEQECDAGYRLAEEDVRALSAGEKGTCSASAGTFERRQEDASEFLRLLFNKIEHEEKDDIKKRRWTGLSNATEEDWDPSKSVLEPVLGRCENTVQCSRCESLSVRRDSFVDLQLPFSEDASKGKPLDLTEMLFYALSTENLEGENQYYCDTCHGLQDATQALSIVDPPPESLILSLNRFKVERRVSNINSEAVHRKVKISTPVSIPSILWVPVIPPHDTGNEKERPSYGSGQQRREYEYELFAIIIHSGSSPDYGHYYAYARDEGEDTIDAWRQFNDSTVIPYTFDRMMDTISRFKDDTPYVLFYRRRGVPPVEAYDIPIPLKQQVAQAEATRDRVASDEYAKRSGSSFGPNKRSRDDDDDHTMERGDSWGDPNRFIY